MATRGMTPEDLTRIKFLSDPQMSPDGTHVAFVVTTLSAERDEYLSNIWIVETSQAQGPTPRQFTTGPKRDHSPRWSPDGKNLAFVAEREPGQKGQLYVIPASGGEPRRLTDLKQGVSDPVWSPDGRQIAFVARIGGWPEPEEGKSKPARFITELKYRHDGVGYVYDRRQHVFVVPTDGRERKQITYGDFDDRDPAWSPDGRSIAFVSARHETRDVDQAADVFLISAEGGDPTRVTDTAGPIKTPVFSPGGRQIVYLGHRFATESSRNMRVYSVPASGDGGEAAGEPTCLRPDLDRTCAPHVAPFRPTWLAGGECVAFGVEDQGDVPVFRLPIQGDGREPERIIAGERQITGLSSSADGRWLAFTATDPVNPADIFLCRADGSDERQLTHLNREWKAEVALSTPERIPYERDGVTLDCWVMKPFGHEEGRQYPALLNIHGGPATQYGHGFFDEFQVYAGTGYAVIFTNPRGSQGYGEDFMRAVLHDWGGVDYADIMAGVDEALRRCPFVDPQRLGVMGGSYGGYMTSWIVGHTNRFRAACSERALNEFSSMFGTSDIGHTFPREHVGVYPWENRAEHQRHSPLTYAPNIDTPLLILHSENDLRCPMEQAEQLFVWLKVLGKEVLFVRFPDEGHEMYCTQLAPLQRWGYHRVGYWRGSRSAGHGQCARPSPVHRTRQA